MLEGDTFSMITQNKQVCIQFEGKEMNNPALYDQIKNGISK